MSRHIPSVMMSPDHYEDVTVAIVEVNAGQCTGVMRTASVWEMPSCDLVKFDFTATNRLALLHVAALFRPLT